MPDRLSTDAELELRDYLSVLWRRKTIVFLAVLLLVSAALGFSYLQTRVYDATASFFLQQGTSGIAGIGGVSAAKGADPSAAIVAVLQENPVVRQNVAEQLQLGDGKAPKATAVAIPSSGIIQVTVESADPKLAAAAADAYVTKYLEFRKKTATDNFQNTINLLQPKYDAAQRIVNDINTRIASALPFAQDALRTQLGSQRDQKLSEANGLKQQIDQLLINVALVSNESIVPTPAKIPKDPVRPKPARNGALAVPVGLVIGVALAFLFEHLDDSLKSKEDLQRITPGIPVLGVIPAARLRDDAGSELVALAAPDSPVAEAYRSMRTSVQFLALDDSLGSIQITSPSAGEGKTTTLANLAVVMARAGAKVVVIDCDLRRPRLHELFGVPNDIGFTSVFQGQVPLSGALQAIPGERNLRVLPSGPLPPNPSELLGSRRTAGILASLKAQGAIVLLDCPPIMPVTDAAALSAWVDTTIVVASYGGTTKRQLHRAIELLRQVDAPLVGTVLNRAQGADGYGYSYGYYHRRPETGSPRRRGAANGQTPPARSPSTTGG